MHAHASDSNRLASPLTAPTDADNFPTEIIATWATCQTEVNAAQRLRHQVFVREMGAVTGHLQEPAEPFESDRFDPYCDHLLIQTRSLWCDQPAQVIGTSRVLRPTQAACAGGFYSDTEFDLTPIDSLRRRALELGRTCVHPDWRNGAVMMSMWRALGQFMQQHRLDTLIGSASISLKDHGYAAAMIWERLRMAHLAPADWQVRPHDALPIAQLLAQPPHPDAATNIPTPPLIKGYLRCGAQVLGPPARDLVFNTADLPMMLRLDALAPRYRKHFLDA